MSAIEQHQDEIQEAGSPAEAGSFACIECSFPVSLDNGEQELPSCPNCGGEEFRRASMFEAPTRDFSAIGAPEPADWLDGVINAIERPGKYLAFYADGRARVVELDEGWSRIGRSGSADIRLDDPTVSRRHAVIVRTPEGELSALDDRSTNGIQVNSESVEFAPIADGDEIQVGRYTLHVIESAGSGPA